MDVSCGFRHRHAGKRCTSIPPVSGLMTVAACGSSTRYVPARYSPASVRATMRRRGPSRLDVEHPSMRGERTPESAAVQYLAMFRQPYSRSAVLRPDTLKTTHDTYAGGGFEAQIGALATSAMNTFNRLAAQCSDPGARGGDDA